jgi:hypothetical protein
MCIHTWLSMTTLSPIEQATLQALADACNWSMSAHVPAQAVTRKFPKHLRGDVKRSLKKLRAKGCCFEHPTGRNTTYQLTPNGLSMAKQSFSAPH